MRGVLVALVAGAVVALIQSSGREMRQKSQG